MKYEIQKHENLSTQSWYGTQLDSQMLFKDTWYKMDKSILDKYFEIGNNGGSYSLNFDSANLEDILKELNISETSIKYLQDITEEGGMRHTYTVTKKEYLLFNTKQTRDEYTDYLAPYFSAML
jgi:hypothetical protein